MPINYVDISILIILLFFVYRGVSNGFLQELSSIVGIIGGFFLAEMYAMELAIYINDYIPRSISYLVAYIVIVLLCLVVASLIARLLRSFLNLIFIGWIDHVLGAFFGLAKGILLTGFLIYIVTAVSFINNPLLQESLFLPYYDPIVEQLSSFLKNSYLF